MRRTLIDLSGHKFGKLNVISISSRRGKLGEVYWDCLCDCGDRKAIRGANIRCGTTRSCGCGKIKHLHTKNRASSSTYNAWHAMRARCENKRNPDYKDYGGRGISVCHEWTIFDNFLRDMGECPKGKSIDRKDNNGNYELKNCRWATNKEQMNNRRNSILVEVDGEKLSLSELADKYKIAHHTLYQRLVMKKMSIDEAIKFPSSRSHWNGHLDYQKRSSNAGLQGLSR